MQIAIPIYERFTALDAVGPYEVLSLIPGAAVEFVASETGPVRADTGALALVADRTLAEVTAPDIVVVPGGEGSRADSSADIVEWLALVHPTTQWTTSVCTGSLMLGAAGLLDGLRATTHWLFHDDLRALGATPTLERVVREGKIITAAGVSAGIDMALTLAGLIAGPEVAQAIQLSIEYDPQPPFDAGSPESAPEPIVALVRALAEQQGSRAS